MCKCSAIGRNGFRPLLHFFFVFKEIIASFKSISIKLGQKLMELEICPIFPLRNCTTWAPYTGWLIRLRGGGGFEITSASTGLLRSGFNIVADIPFCPCDVQIISSRCCVCKTSYIKFATLVFWNLKQRWLSATFCGLDFSSKCLRVLSMSSSTNHPHQDTKWTGPLIDGAPFLWVPFLPTGPLIDGPPLRWGPIVCPLKPQHTAAPLDQTTLLGFLKRRVLGVNFSG